EMPPVKEVAPRLAWVRLECRLFNGVEHESGGEKCVEKLSDWPMEIILRHRLTYDAQTFVPGRLQIPGHLYRVSRYNVPFHINHLGNLSCFRPGVEGRMADGENESTALLKQSGQTVCQRLDCGHVHDRHVADDCVEIPLA